LDLGDRQRSATLLRARHAPIALVVEAWQARHPIDFGKAHLISGHSFFLPGFTQSLLRDIEPDVLAALETVRLAREGSQFNRDTKFPLRTFGQL
jgi:hypothetical protein